MSCDCAPLLQKIQQSIAPQGSLQEGIHKTVTSTLSAEDEGTIHSTLYGKELKDCQESPDGSSTEGEGSGVGKPGAPAPVRFCSWQAPEYGNKGENWWTLAFQAAALAIAIANGIAQQEIADMQMDLADSWYSHAKYKWERFRDNYMPLEKKLLNEVSTVPIPALDCDGAESRAKDAVDLAFIQGMDYFTKYTKQLQLCVDPSLVQYIDRMQTKAHVDSRNYNYVDDRWYKDYKDDQRWNRRSNVLNLGRNMDAAALTYGNVANSLYDKISSQLDRAASGIISAIGYFGARNDTFTPMTYLSTGGAGGGNSLVSISLPSSINPTGMSSAG